MLLTTTPGAAEFSMVSSALNPPKELAPCPAEVGTATTGTSVRPLTTLASAASRPATTTRQSTSVSSERSASSGRIRLPPTSSTRTTSVPVTRATKAASAAIGVSPLLAQSTPTRPTGSGIGPTAADIAAASIVV